MELQKFYNFIYERQLIWHKRYVQKQPWPWTDDPTLRKFKFCCCYRELDASSQHLIKWIIEPKLPLDVKIFNIILFRFFNVRNFFSEIMHGVPDPKQFKAKKYFQRFDKFYAEGMNLKNCAIHTTGKIFPGHPVRHQYLMAAEQVAGDLEAIIPEIQYEASLENYFNVMLKINGVGKFLAFQMAQDIAYIKEIPSVDWNKSVHIGPGAAEGLSVLGLKKNPIEECKFLFQQQEKYLPTEWRNIYYKQAYHQSPYLSLANIQHSVCEARKFWNLSKGVGRKRYYTYKGEENGTKRT